MIETDTVVECNTNEEGHKEERLFDPPLYKQRYHTICKLINQTKATKVLDMGCSEGQFLPIVKSMCPDVEEICGIDIDRSLLERMKFRLQPLTIEFVLRREKPLTMSFLHGSITQPDLRFVDVDFVACIEVIEHLHEEDLKQVPHALFGLLRPKRVAITTPNSEYNVLFKDFSGMRHWDHKFEWTRQEFEEWCNAIENSFPSYKVEFSGIGEPPTDRQDVGCCSQMAVFTRREEFEGMLDCVEHWNFEEIHSVIYPYDELDRKSKILNEIQYLVTHFYSHQDDEDADEIVRRVPLDKLLAFPKLTNLEVNENEAVDLLRNSEIFELSESFKELVVRLRRSDFEEHWFDDGDDDGGTCCHGYENNVEVVNMVQPEEEDWA